MMTIANNIENIQLKNKYNCEDILYELYDFLEKTN